MIFVSKLKVLYSGNLLEQMKPNGTYLNYQVCGSSSGSTSFLYYQKAIFNNENFLDRVN